MGADEYSPHPSHDMPTEALQNLIVKVDPFNSDERDLFRGHEKVPYLQVKYSDSHWLLKNDVTDLLGPDQELILVDWEEEENFIGRDPDNVVRRCVKLQPYIDYAWLGDRWTYEDESRRMNRKQINLSIALQKYYRKRFETLEVDFEYNPMVLGWKRWHLERHRSLLEQFDDPLVGFDATGYRSKYEFAKDVNRTIKTLDVELYVSGRIGPTFLEMVPPEVQAFSGKCQLITDAQLDNGDLSRKLLGASIDRRIRAFEHPQTDLRQFTTATI